MEKAEQKRYARVRQRIEKRFEEGDERKADAQLGGMGDMKLWKIKTVIHCCEPCALGKWVRIIAVLLHVEEIKHNFFALHHMSFTSLFGFYCFLFVIRVIVVVLGCSFHSICMLDVLSSVVSKNILFTQHLWPSIISNDSR